MHLKLLKEASQRVANTVRRTSLEFSSTLSAQSGHPIHLKLENLQVTGSFKIRGALNKVAALCEEKKLKGIIAASAGNHAQGVAFSAQRHGIPAIIVMPENAPISKISATKSYGAQVVLAGETVDDSFVKANELKEEYGYEYIHPFDDELIIAGQGTIGLEIYDQLPNVGTVVVPIGGGGLISGVAIALKSKNKKIRVIGVEATNAASMYQSLNIGSKTTLRHVKTIADGIAVKSPGDLTFAYCHRYVDEIVTVTEEEIASAILYGLERKKTVLEGAGAVPLAALLHGKLSLNGPTALVLSGGNIDVNRIALLIERGLVKNNRRMKLRVILPDRPGALSEITKVIAELRGNILEISHNRQAPNVLIDSAEVSLMLEIRDKEHGNSIITTLCELGYETKMVDY